MSEMSEPPETGPPPINRSQLEEIDYGDNYTVYVDPATGQRFIEDDHGFGPVKSRTEQGEAGGPSSPAEPEAVDDGTPGPENPTAAQLLNEFDADRRARGLPEIPRTSSLDRPTSLFGEQKVERVSYQEAVAQSYAARQEAVEAYITAGKLPDEYRLPETIGPESLLGRRVAALEPFYGKVPARGWQPRVVFSPQRRSFEQWDDLLTGHFLFDQRLPEYRDNRRSDGIENHIRESSFVYPGNTEDASLWDVNLISAARTTPILGISPDGRTCVPDARDAVRKLDEAFDLEGQIVPPNVYDPNYSAERILQRYSPRLDVYLALQLELLEKSEKPVDDLMSKTIGRGYEQRAGQKRETYDYSAVTYRWSRESGKIHIVPYPRDLRLGMGSYEDHVRDLGIRPTVSGRDLVPV